MAYVKRLKQFGDFQRGPYWYGTPLKNLDFEWSKEEKAEIERYCEKTLKNCKEEEMTPLARLKATYAGKPTDRAFIHCLYGNTYGARVLDGFGDMLKPIDIYLNPKLWVKVHLATPARFKLDYPNAYGLSYTEEFWGGTGKLIDYGNPVLVGEPPIKKIEDLEGYEVPDPRLDGLYPGYLWANRELRRIYDDYGLSKCMPIIPRICGGPIGTVMMFMTGWAGFSSNLRKNPELNKACLELATQWEIKYAQAVFDVCRCEGEYMCAMTGASPVKMGNVDNSWIADYWTRIGKAIGPQTPVMYGYAFSQTVNWLPILLEHEALGKFSPTPPHWDSFCGGLVDPQSDPQKAIDFHRDHDLYLAVMGSDKTLLDGPIPAIEEDHKKICDMGRSYSRFCIGVGMVDYWTPSAHVDAGIAAAKKWGKR